MKKDIIRIGTKRKPKLTKKERLLTVGIQTKVTKPFEYILKPVEAIDMKNVIESVLQKKKGS